MPLPTGPPLGKTLAGSHQGAVAHVCVRVAQLVHQARNQVLLLLEVLHSRFKRSLRRAVHLLLTCVEHLITTEVGGPHYLIILIPLHS